VIASSERREEKKTLPRQFFLHGGRLDDGIGSFPKDLVVDESTSYGTAQ
jgi:hypothetical protein